MSKLQAQPWNSLFSAIAELENEQAAQKRQGLNDFNLLGSVLSVNDEVRLHTRFIYALLNPEGRHYQGTRFLELFLQTIGRASWLDLSSVVVRKEHCPNGRGEQIDIYITDGTRQILIENKLNAQDQPRQVARYLEAVDASDPAQADNTLFIYLTKNRQQPSPYGLGGLTVCHQTSHLLNQQGFPLAQYQNLSYRRTTSVNSIHDWLDACVEALSGGSANIAWALEDYRAVVRQATREYESNVKTLRDVLEQGIAEGKGYHEQAIQLARELPAMHRHWLENALTVHIEELLEPAVNTGAVTRIGKENIDLLRPFLRSSVKDAASLLYAPKFNFFHTGNGTRNRGSFYLLETGPLAGKAVLMLFYGSRMIHAGCLLSEKADERGVLKDHELKESDALGKKIFRCALTCAEPLEHQGILHLANFTNSPQRETLHRLMTALVA